jgi:hypothetical protein
MRFYVLGYLLVSFCAGRSTAAVIQDPGGWANAKWGMTETELKQAFPEAALYTSPRSGATFGIPEYEMDGAKVHVGFELDVKAGLQRVRIEPDEKSSVDPNEDAPPSTLARIREILLLSDLKDKYGEPRERTVEPNFDETGLTTHQWRWNFPETSVVLVWKSYENPSYQRLAETYLVYEKREHSGIQNSQSRIQNSRIQNPE